ncbi:MAG TPA: dihydropteroate synthase [Acidimicrobiia bacterium]
MAGFSPVEWRLRTRTLSTGDHTLIMGIVNVTPDSFSDGGAFVGDAAGPADHAAALAHGLRLVADGADVVDVGGESTRPGAADVPLDVELQRVIPVVAELAARNVVVSVDTSKPEVARAALEAGAEAVNDVTALADPAMVEVCATAGAGVVLMHMQGTPRSMQAAPRYGDVVEEVTGYLLGRAAAVAAGGVAAERICIDPGIGFGKALDHNLALLGSLDRLVAAGHPVALGASRKSFLGAILERSGRRVDAADRDPATGATTALAVAAGVAVIRVHDVASTLQVVRIADAIVRATSGSQHD